MISKSFHRIKAHSIILKNAYVNNVNSRFQQVFYKNQIDGQNIEIYTKSKKYRNVKLDQTIDQILFILAPLKTMQDIPGLVFFNENSQQMDQAAIIKEKNSKLYVLLGIAYKDIKKRWNIFILI